jgi:2'-5' RNA ligase
MVRLKIYLAPDEQTVQFCRHVNAQVRSITETVIVFSETSPMLPHITLAMGELVPSQTFEALTTGIKTLVREVQPLTLRLSQPYIEPVQGRYILCDIQENSALTELRKRLSDMILGTYLTTQKSRSSVPHLTLAHIDAQREKVKASLQLVQVISQTICAHIELAHVGPRGTCIDRLCTFHLAHPLGSAKHD